MKQDIKLPPGWIAAVRRVHPATVLWTVLLAVVLLVVDLFIGVVQPGGPPAALAARASLAPTSPATTGPVEPSARPTAPAAPTPTSGPALPRTPSPEGSPAPAGTPGPRPATGGGAPAPAAAALNGVFTFVRYSGAETRFYTWTRGATRLTRQRAIGSDARAFAVSRQGGLAWITGSDTSGKPAELHVATVRPGGRETVVSGLGYVAPCATPAWSPAGTWLIFQHGVGEMTRTELIRADGGGRTLIGDGELACNPVWSANRRYLASFSARADGTHAFLFDLIARRSHQVPGITKINYLGSVSPGGAKVVLGLYRGSHPGTGGVIGRWPPTVADTATGRRFALPVRGAIAAYFLPDAKLLVRVRGTRHNTLVLLAPNLKTRLASLAEPAAARDMNFLGMGTSG